MVTALVALFCQQAVAADEGTYLFDLIKKPGFRETWNSLMRAQKGLPDWLAGFVKNGKGGGPSAPMGVVTVGGTKYQAATICEKHNCPGSYLRMLFTLNGAKAYGAIMSDDSGSGPVRLQRQIGEPSAAMVEAFLNDSMW